MIKDVILRNVVPDNLRRWLRLKKQNVADTLFPYEPYTVTRSRGGYEYKAYIADRMAEGWYAWGEEGVDYPLQPEIRFLQRYGLQPGATIFDLGAHQCVIAVLMANIVGPDGRVVAVEATPRNAKIGERNRALNGTNNLRIVNAAIAESGGHIEFVPENNGSVSEMGGELSSVSVEAITIDTLASEYGAPDVLFIDVEGFEHRALMGGHGVLQSRPDCFVEIHTGCGLEEYGSSVADVIDIFNNLNYDLYHSLKSGNDTHTFKSLDIDSLPSERFFLIAIH